MNKLIYILPERLRRRFQFYRAKLYPIWLKIEFVNNQGKHWVPYHDYVNIERSDVLVYSTEIHGSQSRTILINGDHELLDNLQINISNIQEVVDKHDEVKQLIIKINEDNEDTKQPEEDSDDISEEAQSGKTRSF